MAYDPEKDGPHYVEHTAWVYLKVRGGRWVVDDPKIWETDFGGPTNETCECGEPDECERARRAAEDLPLPDAGELAELLREAAAEERATLEAKTGGTAARGH